MSKELDLIILKQDVSAWNEWRKINSAVVPDLMGAELDDAYLACANLARAELTGAKLRRVDMTGADLREAVLEGAELSEANLSNANLAGANLASAVLHGANLCGANLSQANLDRADLTGADLGGANLRGANLGGVSLDEKNLDGANLSETIMPDGSIQKRDDHSQEETPVIRTTRSGPDARLNQIPDPNQIVEDSLSSDVHDLAHAVLACPSCARLLRLMASRPHPANTLTDLAYLLGESEGLVLQALEVLGKQGLVQQYTIAGEVFYHLTQDPNALVRISEFLDWREKWIDRAEVVIQDMDAGRQAEILKV